MTHSRLRRCLKLSRPLDRAGSSGEFLAAVVARAHDPKLLFNT